jgi:STE24 endopeptidase
MNIYAIIILVTILVGYILSLITEYLNIKALSPQLPEEFKNLYDEDKYAKSQDYTQINTKFEFMTGTFNLVITLIFWFSGGFNYLDQIVRNRELHSIWAGILYIGILILLKSILSLPFSIYSTFVIEERFGLNKTTPSTFILDIGKGFLLSILIGGPLLAGILAFFEYTGQYAWIYCWIGTIIFTLFVQFIAPTWIMPLFNKFSPLEPGELRESIENYADSVNFPLKGVFVMDGSRRSTKANAFFTGFGKNKRIALFDTLIKSNSVSELVSVLAHEIGHYKKKHILKSIILSIIHMGFLFYLLSIFLNHKGLYDSFYMENMSIYAGLIFFGMLYSPIELILSIFMQIFSRRNEYQADQFAATTIDEPESLIRALKNLSVSNLSNLTPHPLYVFLNYSHPPVLERIKAIRATINE